MRVARLVAGTGLLSLLAACGSSGLPVRSGAAGHTATTSKAVPLTPESAQRIFSSFVPRFETMASDKALIPKLTMGAQEQGEEFFGGQWGPTLGSLASEQVFVTKQAGYPRWFLGSGRASGNTGVFFVMVQQSPSAAWRCAAEMLDYGGTSQTRTALSYVNVDSAGYAPAVSPTDSSLAVPPSALAQAYTGYLNRLGRGGGPPFAPGENTTSYISTNKKLFTGASRYGWRITDHQQTTALPVYSMGIGPGAIVIFITRDTTVWHALSSSAVLNPPASSAAAYYAPPALLTKGIGAASVRAGFALTAVTMNRVLALVPPQGKSKIDVALYTGQAVSVTHSGPS